MTKDYLQHRERAFIDQALRGHEGRTSETARTLGVSRKGVLDKIRLRGLRGGDGEG